MLVEIHKYIYSLSPSQDQTIIAYQRSRPSNTPTNIDQPGPASSSSAPPLTFVSALTSFFPPPLRQHRTRSRPHPPPARPKSDPARPVLETVPPSPARSSNAERVRPTPPSAAPASKTSWFRTAPAQTPRERAPKINPFADVGRSGPGRNGWSERRARKLRALST